MRALLPVAIAVTLSGCATHHAHVQSQPDRHVSTDWAAVLAIPVNTYVSVMLDGNRSGYGFIDGVTGTSLTILGYSGTLMIPRAEVVRVEADLPIKRRHSWSRIPIASGILGGLAGIVTGAIQNDKNTADRSVVVLETSPGFAYFADRPPWHTHEKRLVYVRP